LEVSAVADRTCVGRDPDRPDVFVALALCGIVNLAAVALPVVRPEVTSLPVDSRRVTKMLMLGSAARGSAPRRLAALLAIVFGGYTTGTRPSHRALPVVQANPNTARVGVFRNRVMTVMLEAKLSLWPLNGPSRPPMTIEAFGEPGKAPLMPGPLVRVPAGTEVHFSIQNSLASPLTFFVPAWIHGGLERSNAMDSVVIGPGAVGVLTVRATAPGNYVYRGTTPTGASAKASMAGLLAGAIVIDSARNLAPPADRVFVIMETPDSALVAWADTGIGTLPAAPASAGRLVFTINGRSWPTTERVRAAMGDSIHWRILNASRDVHPMHLHGFYYRVDEFDGPFMGVQSRPSPGQMVVTQFMTPFSNMSMTWSPDRPGNWLFHCHIATHLQPDSLSTASDDPYLRGMSGLVIGTIVTGRRGVVLATQGGAVRHVRLVAESESGAAHELRYQL